MSSESAAPMNLASEAPRKKVIRRVKKVVRPEETPVTEQVPEREEDRKVKVKREKTESDAEPEREVEAESTVQETVTTEDSAGVQGKESERLIDELIKEFETLRVQSRESVRRLKEIRKLQQRELKEATRKKKRKVASNNNSRRGFHNPSAVSDELCDFFKMEHGTLVSRTQVTQLLTSYVKENDIQNKENGKFWDLDEPLKKLLGYPEERVGYFNVQKYLVRHFPQSKKLQREQSEEATSSVTVTP